MAEYSKPTTLNKIWGNQSIVSAPSDSKINQGWTVEIPDWEDFQWLDNRQDQFIAYLNQHGLPEWDSLTEYRTNKSYLMGSDGIVYKCILTHTNKNPVSAPDRFTYWAVAFDPAGTSYTKTDSDNTFLKRANNLSDVADVATSRNNLGLKTAALVDTGTSAGNAMLVGAFGLGSSSTPAAIPLNNCNTIVATGFYGGTSSTTNKPPISGSLFAIWHITVDANNSVQIAQDVNNLGTSYTRSRVGNVWGGWGRNYNSNSTSTVINTFLASADAAAGRTALSLRSAAILDTGVSAGQVPVVGTNSATASLAGLSRLNNTATDITNNAGSGSVSFNGLVSWFQSNRTTSFSGFQYLPGGFLLQWATTSAIPSSGGIVTFPTTFPNNCLSITAVYTNSAAPSISVPCNITATAPGNFGLTHTGGAPAQFKYIAVGY